MIHCTVLLSLYIYFETLGKQFKLLSDKWFSQIANTMDNTMKVNSETTAHKGEAKGRCSGKRVHVEVKIRNI